MKSDRTTGLLICLMSAAIAAPASEYSLDKRTVSSTEATANIELNMCTRERDIQIIDEVEIESIAGITERSKHSAKFVMIGSAEETEQVQEIGEQEETEGLDKTAEMETEHESHVLRRSLRAPGPVTPPDRSRGYPVTGQAPVRGADGIVNYD
ncbi:hypothetical protein CDD83_5465 [Cordyceps sp. RAO-2017]|nr:hypothetical protein CDD83_5465 [Cordyceps sp. RAO-2017]